MYSVHNCKDDNFLAPIPDPPRVVSCCGQNSWKTDEARQASHRVWPPLVRPSNGGQSDTQLHSFNFPWQGFQVEWGQRQFLSLNQLWRISWCDRDHHTNGRRRLWYLLQYSKVKVSQTSLDIEIKNFQKMYTIIAGFCSGSTVSKIARCQIRSCLQKTCCTPWKIYTKSWLTSLKDSVSTVVTFKIYILKPSQKRNARC